LYNTEILVEELMQKGLRILISQQNYYDDKKAIMTSNAKQLNKVNAIKPPKPCHSYGVFTPLRMKP